MEDGGLGILIIMIWVIIYMVGLYKIHSEKKK